MSWKSLAATVIAIILVSVVAGTLLHLRRQPARTEDGLLVAGPGAEDGEAEPAIEVQDFAPEHFEEGRPAWKIRLSQLQVEKGGRTITAGKLREGLIYDRKGQPAVRVTADKVDYDTVQYDFDVEGKVRIVSPKGALISTEKVHWDNKTRTLNAPGRVMLRTKDDVTVTTAGLKFDTPTQVVHCPNQVRMQTGRSDVIGKQLEYKLENGAFTLRSVQMVIDIEEAKEETRRG
jgi:hypothetical protein